MEALLKIAKDEGNIKKMYRRTGGVMLQRGIPFIKSLPKDANRARKKLFKEISKSKDTWSHPQVALKDLDLKALGFKPTRLAIPLPGERIATKTWRSGKLHAHKMGDIFLVHADAAAPEGLKGKAMHMVYDTRKALKTMKNALPPILPNS